MFFDDIRLVQDAVDKYGLLLPAVDLGGISSPVIADYDIVLRGGEQTDRYIKLDHPPFQESLGDYTILNPDKGDPAIELLPDTYPERFGTIVCVSVLEHTKNPFEIFDAFRKLLKPNGLLIVSTEFSFPYHASGGEGGFGDHWRFTPTGLEILAKHAGLDILNSDWRVDINADAGVKEIITGADYSLSVGGSQEIKSVAIICRKQQARD